MTLHLAGDLDRALAGRELFPYRELAGRDSSAFGGLILRRALSLPLDRISRLGILNRCPRRCLTSVFSAGKG
jgi:hypothetical protein